MTRKVYHIIVCCFFMNVFGWNDAVAQNIENTENIADLQLQNNKTVKLSELKGKVVLLDFWHRGCAPCLQAIPDLIELQEEFKEDLVIIGVNVYDIQEDVVNYLNYKKANYSSTYKNNDALSKVFGIEAFPTTFLYDKKGNLTKKDIGYRKGGIRSLRNAIKKALKEVNAINQ